MKRTTRNIILVLAICAFVLISGLASAESSGTDGENVTWTMDENGVLTVTGSGSFTQSTVALQFNDRINLKKTIVGPGISYIAPDFFWACQGLTEFDVDPQNAYYCSQDGILYNKSKTLLVRVPCGVMGDVELISGLTAIGPSAAQYCGLNTVRIQEGVTEIGSNAFAGGTIRSVWLPASLEQIKTDAFNSLTRVLTSVHYSGTVNEWSNVIIEGGNEQLLFCIIHCSDGDAPAQTISGSIGTDVTFMLTPEGLLTVSGPGSWNMDAFAQNRTIVSAVLENGVTEVGPSAFYNCNRLSSVSIPDTVGTIRASAFVNTGLQSIHIPYSVKSIGNAVFSYCDSLTEVFYGGTVDEWQALVNGTDNEKLDECIIHCSDDDITPKPKEGTIGDEVRYILTLDGMLTVSGNGTWSDWAFNGNNRIISAELENGVTEIGYGAFAWCSNLSQIFIPDTVTEIKYEAFYGCYSLASVTIPESVKTIGDEVFDGCEILEEIRFEGTKAQWQELVNGTINEKFSECVIKCTDGDVVGTKEGEGDGFTWILAGDELTINGTSFDGYNLDYDIVRKAKKVTISTTINQLNNLHALENAININAEEGNENFRSVDGVLFTHDLKMLYAFPAGRTGTYTVPEGTTALGESAFDVSKIDELILPSTLQRIEARALNALRNITEITIPASVTYIDEEYGSNFSNCDSLVNILVEEENDTYYDRNGILYQKNGDILLKYAAGRKEKNVTIDAGAVAAFAFQGSQDLESVIFAPGIESIGEEAFFYSGITTVTLPVSLRKIEYRVFYGCSLSDVTYTGTMEEWNNIEIDSSVYQLFLMNIRCSDGTLYQQEMSGSLGEGITYTLTSDGLLNVYGAGSWEDRPFQNNEYVKRVILDSDVTEIGMLAFLGCANLKSIEIPKTVASIGNSALAACDNLTDIYYEGSAEEWDAISVGFNNEILNNVNKYFYWNGWEEISNILTLPEMLTTIESEAFAGLTNVDAVRISGNVTEIADDAFAGTDLVILAPAGSYAEEWAGEHGIACRND